MSSLPQPRSTKTRQKLHQFAAFIRDSKASDPEASDPDFVLPTTPEEWKAELEAWRTLVDFILEREEGPMLSLDQFVASLEGVEHPTEVAAFEASTREDARHDPTWPLARRTVDWRREFEAWRGVQRLVRLGALRSLTKDQLKAFGMNFDGTEGRTTGQSQA